MKQLTLRKAANYLRKETFKCSAPYFPSLQNLLLNKLNESMNFHENQAKCNFKKKIRCDCAKEKTMNVKK